MKVNEITKTAEQEKQDQEQFVKELYEQFEIMRSLIKKSIKKSSLPRW